MHDLARVAELTRHFDIPTLVCVNKWDLNPDVASQIEQQALRRGLQVTSKVRYDQVVTEAQIRRLSLVEYAVNGVADEIRRLWADVQEALPTREGQ